MLEQKRQAAIARRDAKKALRLKDVILEKKKAAMARRKKKEANMYLMLYRKGRCKVCQVLLAVNKGRLNVKLMLHLLEV